MTLVSLCLFTPRHAFRVAGRDRLGPYNEGGSSQRRVGQFTGPSQNRETHMGTQMHHTIIQTGFPAPVGACLKIKLDGFLIRGKQVHVDA